jgi:uncharacterized protein YlxW (UPF0749 family)
MSSEAPPASPAQTDPSAALVERIAADALNPSYRERAQERFDEGAGRRRRGVVVTVLAILAVGLLVGALLVGAQQQADLVESERSSLVALAAQARDEVAVLEEQVADLDAQVRELRERTLGSQELGARQTEAISQLGIVAGVAPVAGPGARVVVADGDTAVGGGDAALSQVLDIDLQQVVNGLWEAGAESVAVNGQRVGALTAIRSVQDTILVNYNPVIGPYQVDAIGDPRTLATGFLRSSGGQWLQAVNLSAGIRFSIDSVGDDTLLPGEPAGPLRYAVATETLDTTEDAA